MEALLLTVLASTRYYTPRVVELVAAPHMLHARVPRRPRLRTRRDPPPVVCLEEDASCAAGRTATRAATRAATHAATRAVGRAIGPAVGRSAGQQSLVNSTHELREVTLRL